MNKDNFEFMELLDWNRSEIDRIRGIEIAKVISDLSIFMQPMTENFNKNVWDNCAKIICEKSDKELEPYLMQLLEWIQDLNWPGAIRIFNRLETFSDRSSILELRAKCIELANFNSDEVWKTNLMKITTK